MTKEDQMQKIWVPILESARQYGLSIVILGLGVYTLNQQSMAYQKKLEDCNGHIIQNYREQNEVQSKQNRELINVLDKNTEAINVFSDIVKDLK